MKRNKQIRIVLTGAESTGKSSMAERLVEHFGAVLVPEFARGYVEKLDRAYNKKDVLFIAEEQIRLDKEMCKSPGLYFIDTWLIITKVWLEYVYGESPSWLNIYLKESKVDLFLLCNTDLPWVDDPVRENGGESREELQKIYLDQLKKYKFDYRIISGTGNRRIQNAIEAVNDFLNEKEAL